LFVFGDSFADNGNLAKDATQRVADKGITRQWYFPYGFSASGSAPTGRFSNGRVQSDFIDRQLREPHLLRAISPAQLAAGSVALIAVSGNDDYGRVTVSVFGDVTTFIKNVTSTIAASADRLRKLGTGKVLVNNLHPVGCVPSQTRAEGYGACDSVANAGAPVHKQERKARWRHGRRQGPQGDTEGGPYEYRYTLCEDPERYFYWDEMHPTQAAWEAVMWYLQEDINKFLGPAQQ
ncbi:hypothetical protein BRADI_1g58951v3, partial [Brachypodium distachyon]